MTVSPEVAARLQALHDASGTLTPDAVVEDAKDPDSPLHDCFNWDVESAALSHWRSVARGLISSVRLIIKTEKYSLSAVAYVRDPDKRGCEQGYSSVISLRTDEERARKALIAELHRADSALQRAYDVASSLGLDGEIEQLRARISGVMEAA